MWHVFTCRTYCMRFFYGMRSPYGWSVSWILLLYYFYLLKVVLINTLISLGTPLQNACAYWLPSLGSSEGGTGGKGGTGGLRAPDGLLLIPQGGGRSSLHKQTFRYVACDLIWKKCIYLYIYIYKFPSLICRGCHICSAPKHLPLPLEHTGVAARNADATLTGSEHQPFHFWYIGCTVYNETVKPDSHTWPERLFIPNIKDNTHLYIYILLYGEVLPYMVSRLACLHAILQ